MDFKVDEEPCGDWGGGLREGEEVGKCTAV